MLACTIKQPTRAALPLPWCKVLLYLWVWIGGICTSAWAGLGEPVLDGALRYDEVCWVCTHNSMNNAQDKWIVPNQQFNIAHQLRDGVHAQMWDVWLREDKVVLRHGGEAARLLGECPLATQLEVLKKYLQATPSAIVTILFESYVPPARLGKEIEKAGLADLCHTQPIGQAWPTLHAMREEGKRLVLFIDNHTADAPAWLMPMWKHCADTPWQARAAAQLANTLNRGKAENALLIVNHFLANPLPSAKLSEQVNQPEIIRVRYKQIVNSLKRKPNFWVLDFYHLKDAHKAVP